MRARTRTGVPAVALAAVLIASGCGSDNGDDDATDQQTTEETTTDDDTDEDSDENSDDSDDTDPAEDDAEEEQDDPTPAPDDEPLDEMIDDDPAAVAEAIEHMQGVWESEHSETRVLAVDGSAVVLMDDGTACTGGHDEGPVPITLAVYCDDDPPRVANTTGDGETLTLDWSGEEPETYHWLADSIEELT